MGKKSTKENKNIYQLSREEAGMTRMNAADVSGGILSERLIEKIENNVKIACPIEVLCMSEIYSKPELCNYFCTKECEIGKKYVPEVTTIHELPQITLALLSNLNTLNRDKERLIDITADGKISDDERNDFELFKQHLDEMHMAIETLSLWVDKKLS